jgi:hypothetical protein
MRVAGVNQYIVRLTADRLCHRSAQRIGVRDRERQGIGGGNREGGIGLSLSQEADRQRERPPEATCRTVSPRESLQVHR